MVLDSSLYQGLSNHSMILGKTRLSCYLHVHLDWDAFNAWAEIPGGHPPQGSESKRIEQSHPPDAEYQIPFSKVFLQTAATDMQR